MKIRYSLNPNLLTINFKGDLNLNIFLLIKELTDYNFVLLKTIFTNIVDNYSKAEEFGIAKGDKFIHIKYLPIFNDFLKKIKVLHYLDVKKKLIGLKANNQIS